MPRYFFDIIDGDSEFHDDVGAECHDLRAARDEAARALGEMVRDYIPGDGPSREFVVHVRGENGDRVLEASIAFQVRPPI